MDPKTGQTEDEGYEPEDAADYYSGATIGEAIQKMRDEVGPTGDGPTGSQRKNDDHRAPGGASAGAAVEDGRTVSHPQTAALGEPGNYHLANDQAAAVLSAVDAASTGDDEEWDAQVHDLYDAVKRASIGEAHVDMLKDLIAEDIQAARENIAEPDADEADRKSEQEHIAALQEALKRIPGPKPKDGLKAAVDMGAYERALELARAQ